MSKPSIAIVNCYKQPDYVRAVSLRQGLRDSDVFENVIVVKNTHTGVQRYLDVIIELIKVRFTQNPDVYLLTFRGYEILPFLMLIALGKKVVYDEFINPYEWFVYEHKKFSASSLPGRLLKSAFQFMGRHVTTILADTQSHADYSAELMDIPIQKYKAIPVSTDEETFQPIAPRQHDGFRVLYYGNMLPLHGVQYVIDAATKLADHKDIIFHLVGGKEEVARRVEDAVAEGAHIEYDEWIPYAQLPEAFAQSDLCLGGPFGGTVQSQFVVTGKTYQFMAAEKPAVIGANKESHVFKDGIDSLIVPEANPDALAEAILWAKDHPMELQKIAAAGRQLYEKEFSNKRVADDLRDLFTTLL